MTIRKCTPAELDEICVVINDAAEIYKEKVAPDRWKNPYMPAAELQVRKRLFTMISERP